MESPGAPAEPDAPAEELARAFDLGRPVLAEVLKRGHIHRTHVLVCEGAGGPRRYVLQEMNTHVFAEPDVVMENLVRVTEHLARKLGDAPDAARRALRVLPAPAGPLHRDAAGRLWRCFPFIEGTVAFDEPTDPAQAYRAARAFGAFAAALADLEPPPRDTIPHFHDFPRRCRALERSAAVDRAGRAAGVGADLEASARLQGRILAEHDLALLPARVVHNDCKLNNLLFDAATGEALCVVDLDTVMTGSLVFDFGSLVRTAACRAPEDETDLGRVRVDAELLGALVRGYGEGAGAILTDAERAALPLAGARMALEDAVRFLTDHLDGDVYYRVHRPGHNLDRHRAQRVLGERLLEAAGAVRSALPGGSGG